MSKVSFEKKGIVKEIAKEISPFSTLLIANHHKLTVEEIEELKQMISSISSYYLVVKNTLFRIALKKLKKNLSFNLNGQSGVCYGSSIEELSQVLIKFKKKHSNFIPQGGIVGKDFFSSKYIEKIAALPSREVLITGFLSIIQTPLKDFSSLLKEHLRMLVRVVEEIKKSK